VEQVEALLGQALDAPREQRLVIEGSVAAGLSGYTAELRFDSALGSDVRRLTHGDCGQLGKASALVIAIAIDPERVQQNSANSGFEAPVPGSPDAGLASPESAKRDELPPEPPPVEPREALPSRSGGSPKADSRPPRAGHDVRTWRFSAEALGLYGVGLLPEGGSGLGIELGVEQAQFRIGASGRYWLTQSRTVEAGQSARIDLSAWSAGVRGCGIHHRGAWRLGACVGPDIGSMTGRGKALQAERTRSDRWSALAGGFGVGHAGAGWFIPSFGFELAYLFERPRFGIRRDGTGEEVFQPAPVTFSGYFAFGVLL
jgi:hypothetical protein